MDFIIMAVMAYANPIFRIMAKLRVLINWLDVVGLKVSVSPAKTTLVAVTLDYLVLPFKILRTTPTLILLFINTPPPTEALLAAKMMIVSPAVTPILEV